MHLLQQPLHHPPQLCWRIAGDHLDIANPVRRSEPPF